MNKSMLGVIFSTIIWSSLSLASTPVVAPQQFASFSECDLVSGQVIKPCQIGYRTYGTLNEKKNNGINKTPMLKVIPPQSWKHKPLNKIPLD